MKKNAFLLHGVEKVTLALPTGSYDQELELNTIVEDNAAVPFVLSGSNPTESKTYQYPADDDPDPDDERCY